MQSEELDAFAEYAKKRIQLGQAENETLEDCLKRWREIEKLKQAISEIETLHEAAAGCGYSRDEILAQYQDRLERLLGE